jgi:hypothetical protein
MIRAQLIPEVIVEVCAVFLKEGEVFFLKGSCPMMFELLLDVMDRFLNLRDANAECAIALLPSKVSEVCLMNPSRCLLLSIERPWQRPIS